MQNQLRYLLKLPVLHSLTYAMKMLRYVITEETQIEDKSKVFGNRELLSGPCLWIIKHETTLDPVNIMPLWREAAHKPDMKFVAKQFNTTVEKVFGAVCKPFIINFYRPGRGEAKTPEDKARMEAENKESMKIIKSHYLRNVHCAIMPEGTTETDGTVYPIKSGCYTLSSIENKGELVKIPMLPIGLTYDMLSGGKHWLTGKRRTLVFVNMAKPITYEKFSEDIKQDIKYHTRKVRDILVAHNTITTAQLAGEYITIRASKGEQELSESRLQDLVAARIEGLSKLEGLTFDRALLNETKRQNRVANLYNNIQDYMTGENKVSLEKVLLEADPVTYKKKNPLRYCANRLIQASEQREDMREVLDRTREQL